MYIKTSKAGEKTSHDCIALRQPRLGSNIKKKKNYTPERKRQIAQ